MSLLEECIAALSDNLDILNKEDSKRIYLELISDFPTTNWGRIDWDSIDYKECVGTISECEEIMQSLKISNDNIYIIWDEVTLPVLSTSVKSVINNIYDVLAVSANTWIYSEKERIVIEFYHENEINIGFRKC